MSGPSSFDDAAGLERVTATLRRQPPVDPRAIDRVVRAALGRERDRRRRRVWMARAAALALAVGLGAGGVWYGRHGADRAHPTVAALPASLPASLPATVPATPTAAVTPATEVPSHAGGANVARLRLATIDGADEAPVVVTFALRRPGAHRVALVGDFDEWSPTAVPMSRAADGTWTASVRLTPGRHAYAFVVDDHAWATDPKAPLVRDPDYGRDQSIVVVGQP